MEDMPMSSPCLQYSSAYSVPPCFKGLIFRSHNAQ